MRHIPKESNTKFSSKTFFVPSWGKVVFESYRALKALFGLFALFEPKNSADFRRSRLFDSENDCFLICNELLFVLSHKSKVVCFDIIAVQLPRGTPTKSTEGPSGDKTISKKKFRPVLYVTFKK